MLKLSSRPLATLPRGCIIPLYKHIMTNATATARAHVRPLTVTEAAALAGTLSLGLGTSPVERMGLAPSSSVLCGEVRWGWYLLVLYGGMEPVTFLVVWAEPDAVPGCWGEMGAVVKVDGPAAG
jgi:hypothetical protein